MDEIAKAFEKVKNRVIKEVNDNVAQAFSGRITNLSSIKTTIMGKFIHEVLTGQVSAINGITQSAAGIDQSRILIENTKNIPYKIKTDVMLRIYSNDEKTDKKIRLAFFGGDEEGVVISPDLRIRKGSTPNLERLSIALQEHLMDRISEEA